MKLFITNKAFMDSLFEDQKQVHVKAYHELKISIETESKIPLIIAPFIEDDKQAIFVFKSCSNDVYYYEFNQTIS